eukprot:RCo026820
MEPLSDRKTVVLVRVVGARNLLDSTGTNAASAYVSVRLGSSVSKTCTKKHARNPAWDETFVFHSVLTLPGASQESTLRFQVHDDVSWPWSSGNPLFSSDVNLLDLPLSTVHPLSLSAERSAEEDSVMTLEVQVMIMHWLSAPEHRDLSKQLLLFRQERDALLSLRGQLEEKDRALRSLCASQRVAQLLSREQVVGAKELAIEKKEEAIRAAELSLQTATQDFDARRALEDSTRQKDAEARAILAEERLRVSAMLEDFLKERTAFELARAAETKAREEFIQLQNGGIPKPMLCSQSVATDPDSYEEDLKAKVNQLRADTERFERAKSDWDARYQAELAALSTCQREVEQTKQAVAIESAEVKRQQSLATKIQGELTKLFDLKKAVLEQQEQFKRDVIVEDLRRAQLSFVLSPEWASLEFEELRQAQQLVASEKAKVEQKTAELRMYEAALEDERKRWDTVLDQVKMSADPTMRADGQFAASSQRLADVLRTTLGSTKSTHVAESQTQSLAAPSPSTEEVKAQLEAAQKTQKAAAEIMQQHTELENKRHALQDAEQAFSREKEAFQEEKQRVARENADNRQLRERAKEERREADEALARLEAQRVEWDKARAMMEMQCSVNLVSKAALERERLEAEAAVALRELREDFLTETQRELQSRAKEMLAAEAAFQKRSLAHYEECQRLEKEKDDISGARRALDKHYQDVLQASSHLEVERSALSASEDSHTSEMLTFKATLDADLVALREAQAKLESAQTRLSEAQAALELDRGRLAVEEAALKQQQAELQLEKKQLEAERAKAEESSGLADSRCHAYAQELKKLEAEMKTWMDLAQRQLRDAVEEAESSLRREMQVVDRKYRNNQQDLIKLEMEKGALEKAKAAFSGLEKSMREKLCSIAGTVLYPAVGSAREAIEGHRSGRVSECEDWAIGALQERFRSLEQERDRLAADLLASRLLEVELRTANRVSERELQQLKEKLSSSSATPNKSAESLNAGHSRGQPSEGNVSERVEVSSSVGAVQAPVMSENVGRFGRELELSKARHEAQQREISHLQAQCWALQEEVSTLRSDCEKGAVLPTLPSAAALVQPRRVSGEFARRTRARPLRPNEESVTAVVAREALERELLESGERATRSHLEYGGHRGVSVWASKAPLLPGKGPLASGGVVGCSEVSPLANYRPVSQKSRRPASAPAVTSPKPPTS